MRLLFLLSVIFICCFLKAESQTNSWVTEYYLSQHFTPKAGVTPGTNNTLWMSCDQILARYQVTISGTTTTGNRWPSQNQLTASCASPTVTGITFPNYPNDACEHITITTTVGSDGGCTILERGICYNTTGNPDINSSKVVIASTTGSITTDITLPTGSYYFTAYAMNANGITYRPYSYAVPVSSCCPTIGTSYGGGKLAYVYKPGDAGYVAGECHGIIISSVNLSNATWGCEGLSITGADSPYMGDGGQNTSDIINQTTGCNTPNIAADLCDDYTSGGYSDWVLMTQFDWMDGICSNAASLGLVTNDEYWTSTEYSSNNATSVKVGTCNGSFSPLKSTTKKVRAVRYF